MDNLLIEAVKQVPALTVLTIVVWKLVTMFLKTATDSQNAYLQAAAQSRQEFLASLRQQQNENLDSQKATREVIKESSVAQIKNSEALIKLTEAINGLATETRANTAKLNETTNRG